MKCLVSGATGFIGRRLCPRLTMEGHSVTAWSKSGAALADGTPTRALDLTASLPAVNDLHGHDVLFHLAGIAHQRAADAAYTGLNERATVELARRAAQAGVGRFVFVSSVKAMGHRPGGRPRAEDDCVPPTDPYGLSKWRAESALRREFADSAMSVVILRPALVYGARPKGNLALLARGVKAGLPRPPALGSRSMVALEDLVEALLLVAAVPLAGVHTWIVADSQAYSTRSIYDAMRRATGRGEGRAWLPTAGWRLGAAVLDLFRGDRDEPTFDKLFGSELYSSAALSSATGWQARTHLEELAQQMIGNTVTARQ